MHVIIVFAEEWSENQNDIWNLQQTILLIFIK